MNAFEAANHYIRKASRIMDLGPRVLRVETAALFLATNAILTTLPILDGEPGA